MIEKVKWNDSYLLGIKEIDDQHKKLISLADQLYDCISLSQDQLTEKLPQILKELTDYTVYHFDHEIEFMKKYDYIGYDAHKTAHDNFVQTIKHEVVKLDSGNIKSVETLYSFLTNWILTHIAKADRVWAKFVLLKL